MTRPMLMILIIGLFCSSCLASAPSQRSPMHAPWVTCSSEDGKHSTSKKRVRTPLVTSSNGRLKAFAEIEAERIRGGNCQTEVRLFVSEPGQKGFRQVYDLKPSEAEGTLNSLGPVSWSPDGRWLLIEFGNWWEGSDAGGLEVLLYDRHAKNISITDLPSIIRRTLNRECSITIVSVIGFNASSQVLLRLADSTDEGETEPLTHCFQGTEDWRIDPQRSSAFHLAGHP